MPPRLTATFKQFVDSEKSAGVVLMACTVISLVLANSALADDYTGLWHGMLAGLSIEHWINDALMAVFFLLIGLELKRELLSGELSSVRKALLPAVAAIGGMVVPAAIHFAFNAGTATQAGAGIPMATDIAFALGVLALLGSRVPASLKVLVVAFAVFDDLGAVIIIAAFYSTTLSIGHLAAALAVWAGLCLLNRWTGIRHLAVYLVGGIVLWYLMLQSGVHATIAGVLLAFAIPSSRHETADSSPAQQLEHALHKPVAFLILPLFALANTAIPVGGDWIGQLLHPNSLGITLGLFVGKPLGITVLCAIAIAIGLCRLPDGLRWKHVLGAGLLGGIGFTMSIFITNLAFAGQTDIINGSKLAVLVASLLAGIAAFFWLRNDNAPATKQARPEAR